MKQKLFMMLAALMVLGTSAMAQSETLKGDVNGDGVVDVADIAAVIKIMADEADNNGETKYYWYVGQEVVTADNYTTLEGIQQVESYPTKYEYTPSKRARLYIVIADNKTVTKIEDAVSLATATFSEDTTVSIPGYKVYKSGGAISGKVNIYIN